jgi:hypothetical protein
MGVGIYLLARDWAGAGRDSLQMSIYVVFCCAILRFRTGGYVLVQPPVALGLSDGIHVV